MYAPSDRRWPEPHPAAPEGYTRSVAPVKPQRAGCGRLGSSGGMRFCMTLTLAVVLAGSSVLRQPLDAQGMAAASKRDRPPIPLPAGVVPPRANFVDIAEEAGLRGPAEAGQLHEMKYLTETTGTGVALFDFDNDGLLDIFLVGSESFARTQEGTAHTLYRNLGSLRFEPVGREAGLSATGWGQGVCAGDFDGDGFTDLFVTHWGQDILLRNQDGSRFRDETLDRGLAGDASRWSTGCSFLDFDRDDDLDLFVAHYVDFDTATTPLPGGAPQCEWRGAPIPCGPRGLAGESMTLFENLGDGQFQDATGRTGVGTANRYHGLGVLASDLDGDGWTDLFVACDSTANLFFRNQGDGTFAETGLLAGNAYDEDGREQAGMGLAAADYNRDGLLDLFQTNFAADTNTIYVNQGNGFFRDRTVPSGLATATQFVGWGAEFLDFDHDGWPDIFAVNGHVAPSVDSAGINETFAQPRLLFWNRGDGGFHPVSQESGAGISDRRPSRGSAVGDLDNDGDLEIVVVNIGQRPSLLKNLAEPDGNWLSVRAVSRAGSDAIGARVTVRAGDTTMIDEVRSGGSYLSQGDFRLHFGLGDIESAEVSVGWPSGSPDSTRRVSANGMVTVAEPAASGP